MNWGMRVSLPLYEKKKESEFALFSKGYPLCWQYSMAWVPQYPSQRFKLAKENADPTGLEWVKEFYGEWRVTVKLISYLCYTVIILPKGNSGHKSQEVTKN